RARGLPGPDQPRPRGRADGRCRQGRGRRCRGDRPLRRGADDHRRDPGGVPQRGGAAAVSRSRARHDGHPRQHRGPPQAETAGAGTAAPGRAGTAGGAAAVGGQASGSPGQARAGDAGTRSAAGR
ncbi:unnamed protein product, partial [Penicillium discolor]